MGIEVAAPDVIVQAVRDLAAPGSVGLLGWWLSGRFRKGDENARAIAEKVAEKAAEAIRDHEKIDKQRHQENLSMNRETSDKITDIQIKLARNGINGKHRAGDGR